MPEIKFNNNNNKLGGLSSSPPTKPIESAQTDTVSSLLQGESWFGVMVWGGT